MGDNLPPGVSISDPDAPWNQQHPDPSEYRVTCPEPECGWRGTVEETENHLNCPECGTDVEEH